jgi:hypothetical protein
VELRPLLPPCACELLVDVVCRMKKENREEEEKKEKGKRKRKMRGKRLEFFSNLKNFREKYISQFYELV